MGRVRREHVLPGVVETGDLMDKAVTGPKTADTFLQQGIASVTFPFAAAGEENVSASVTFPTSFPAGTVPSVALTIAGANVGIVSVTVTETGFTLTVRDDKGTDYTAGQAATVRWIAIAK